MNRQCPQNLTDEQVEQYQKQVERFLKYQNLSRDEVVISAELLEETILTLEHARKFITSRWIAMHPDGVELYDECIAKLKGASNETT